MSEFIGKWLPQESFIGNEFLQECENIVSDINIFNNFKQNVIFRQVIGNDVLSKTISDVLYNNIENDNFIINNIHIYKTNDKYGNPILYEYLKTGVISPGTLYFLNILQSLKKHFKDISNFDIVEIGSGYGGQSKIILDSGIKSYSMIDVKQTLSLCKYYLELFNYKNINFYFPENIKKKSYDLVISNWCLSEFDESGILYYIENVIQYCNNGFFLMNIWDSRKEYLLEKLKPYFSDIQIYPEYPKTHQNNNWLLVIKK
jgi:putative sugar O-methyltransferase